MRNDTLIRWSVGGVLIALLFSCAPKKQMVSSGGNEVEISGAAKEGVMDQVAQRQLSYTTFSGRAKSSVTINGKDRYDVTANIRLVRGKAIWISMTALMGVEVARVFITPDSIKVINRLRAEYLGKPFAYLHHFTGGKLDFASLERLLVGDVPNQLTGDSTAVWRGADGYLLQGQSDDLAFTARVDADYQNQYTAIAAPASHKQLEAFYSDYESVGEAFFPNRMEISMASPHFSLQSEMAYSNVVYDGAVELPFAVPSRYTEVQ